MATIYGTSGTDNLQGTNQNDFFIGYAGDDEFDGGDGFDAVRYDLEAFSGSGITVNLALGIATDAYGNTDTLINIEGAYGTQAADTFRGSTENNIFYGYEGDDYFADIGGSDIYYGGDGALDYVSYRDSQDVGITIDMTTNTVTTASGNTDYIYGIEGMEGTVGSDHLIGDDQNNYLHGFQGGNILEGGLGDDTYVLYYNSMYASVIESGGFDEVYVSNTAATSVSLAEDYTGSTITLAQSIDGHDLYVKWYNLQTTHFVVEDHFIDPDKALEQIRLRNGTIFSLENVTPYLVTGTGENDTFEFSTIDGRSYHAFNPDNSSAVGDGDVADFSGMSEAIVIDLSDDSNGSDYAQTKLDYETFGQGGGTVNTMKGFETVIGSDFNDIIRDVGKIAYGGAGVSIP